MRRFFNYHLLFLLATLAVCSLFCSFSFDKAGDSPKKKSTNWVGTWATAIQMVSPKVEPHNLPPQPGLSNNSFRQILKVSIGGEKLQMRFSNEFGESNLEIKGVNIALAKEGGLIDTKSVTKLTFGGSDAVTIKDGERAMSDAFDFKLAPRTSLAVTIYFGNVPSQVTAHPGSRTTSFILEGNALDSEDFAGAVKTDHWYIIESINVEAKDNAAAVAILGNSITDGRGSTTNQQNRWTDILAERLLNNKSTDRIGVLNMGLGGNCVLHGGLGPTALVRYKRDLIERPGVKYVILFEGVNDLGGTRDANRTATDLIAAFTKITEDAHANGLIVYGATIMPIKNSFYYSPKHDSCRVMVNEWIRTYDKFDGVIDFDKTMGSESDPLSLDKSMTDNDFLHPSAAGHRAMGESVDLNLFVPKKSPRPSKR